MKCKSSIIIYYVQYQIVCEDSNMNTSSSKMGKNRASSELFDYKYTLSCNNKHFRGREERIYMYNTNAIVFQSTKTENRYNSCLEWIIWVNH